MVMDRLKLTIAALFLATGVAAQEAESMIALTPYVERALDRVPETASRSLERKLTSMATANGFASVSGDFVLTAVPDIVNTSVTATAPAQYVAEVEVAVYVLNNPEELVVDQKVYSLKGVGASEQKAVVNAISQIDVRSVDTRRFMENVRTKMIDYYTMRLPDIMAKAQSLSSMSRYEEALAVLAVVPECLDEYHQVTSLMVDIYTDCIDRDAKMLLAESKAYMSQGDYASALKKLVKVDPNSTLFGEADGLLVQVRDKIDAENQAALERELLEYEQKKKEYQDSVDIEKEKISASRDIAAMAVSVSEASRDSEGDGKTMLEWFLGNLL